MSDNSEPHYRYYGGGGFGLVNLVLLAIYCCNRKPRSRRLTLPPPPAPAVTFSRDEAGLTGVTIHPNAPDPAMCYQELMPPPSYSETFQDPEPESPEGKKSLTEGNLQTLPEESREARQAPARAALSANCSQRRPAPSATECLLRREP